jgi:hypothetical protein
VTLAITARKVRVRWPNVRQASSARTAPRKRSAAWGSIAQQVRLSKPTVPQVRSVRPRPVNCRARRDPTARPAVRCRSASAVGTMPWTTPESTRKRAERPKWSVKRGFIAAAGTGWCATWRATTAKQARPSRRLVRQVFSVQTPQLKRHAPSVHTAHRDRSSKLPAERDHFVQPRRSFQIAFQAAIARQDQLRQHRAAFAVSEKD